MRGLNFAKRPFRNQRLPQLVYAVLAATVAAFSLAHAFALTPYLLRETQAELDTKVAALRQEAAGLDEAIAKTREEVSSPRSAANDARVKFVASLFRRKGFSWTAFFNELETLTPPNVRILSITPQEKDGDIEVKMEVVGRSLEDVLEMVKNLEESEVFGSVLPNTEGEVDEKDGGGVEATLNLSYTPERRAAAPPAEKVGS